MHISYPSIPNTTPNNSNQGVSAYIKCSPLISSRLLALRVDRLQDIVATPFPICAQTLYNVYLLILYGSHCLVKFI